MDSQPEGRTYAMAAAATALSALGLYLGSGLHPVCALAWLAPLPVLLLAPRVSARLAFASALVAWGTGGLALWRYLHDVIGIPLVPVLWIVWAPAAVFALAVLAYRRLLLRGRIFSAALGLPAAWVGYEYLLASFSPHGTFSNIGYSQMDFLPVLQVASVLGLWGIGYCVLLFPAVLAAVLSRRGSAAQRGMLALGGSAALVVVLSFGAWRLGQAPGPAARVTVGLVASDLRENRNLEDCAGSLRLLRDYAAQADGLAARGAQAIVMPEKLGVVSDECLQAVDPLYLATASRTRAAIVVGVTHAGATGTGNEARVYLPGATTAATYDKHHMLPLFESHFRVGTARTVWPEPSGKWGVAICKDMDFPTLGRQYAGDGVGLLLVPAWDFDADGWLHGRMAVMRGVESGFGIARAPRQGALTVTDDRGRVLAEAESSVAPFATLVATVPVSPEATFYSRHGDGFAWLCLAGAVLALRRATSGPRVRVRDAGRGAGSPSW